MYTQIPRSVLAVGVAVLTVIRPWQWFMARTEEKLPIRIGSAGMAVTAAGLLAMVLTVTKAGTDELPLVFGLTVSVVLTLA